MQRIMVRLAYNLTSLLFMAIGFMYLFGNEGKTIQALLCFVIAAIYTVADEVAREKE